MNRTSLAALSLISGAVLLHCGGDQKPADAPAPAYTMAPAELPAAPDAGPDAGAPPDAAKSATDSVKPDATQPDPGKPEVLNDQQIASITDSANSAEIEEGKLARLKSEDRDIQSFAAKMIAAHEEAKKTQDNLKLPTADSMLGNTLGTESAKAMNTLKSMAGKGFDKAYIDEQVTAHQQLLDALNDKMLPNVKNPDLKAYLQQILAHVTRHLKEAREIQNGLGAKTAPAAGAKTSK